MYYSNMDEDQDDNDNNTGNADVSAVWLMTK